METNHTNNGEEMTTETQTITCKFTRDEDSDRVITQRVTVTLPSRVAFTDFSDAAWQRIYAKYPDAQFVDEL